MTTVSLSDPPPSYDEVVIRNTPSAPSEAEVLRPSADRLLPPATGLDVEDTGQPPPPAYDQQLVEPPPTYESLFGVMRTAQRESSGIVDFSRRLLTILQEIACFKVFCGAIVCLFAGFLLTLVVIGALYLNDCPAQPHLPQYLIVAGICPLTNALLLVLFHPKIGPCRSCKRMLSEEEDCRGCVKTWSCLTPIVLVFLAAWLVAGTIWVFMLAPRYSTVVGNPHYCHPRVFYLAFWSITSVYILCGLFVIVIFCYIFTSSICWQSR